MAGSRRSMRIFLPWCALATTGCVFPPDGPKAEAPGPGFAQGATITPFSVPRKPQMVADGDGHLWGQRLLFGDLFRLDERTLETAHPALSGNKLAFCAGSLWNSGGHWFRHSTERIEVATGKRIATFPVDGEIAASADSVYVLHSRGKGLARIDPASDSIAARAELDGATRLLAVGAGAVWLLQTEVGLLERYDALSLEKTATLPLVSELPKSRRGSSGAAFVGLGASEDAVWIAHAGAKNDCYVLRVSADGRSIVARIDLHDRPKAPASWRGFVWVPETGSNDTPEFQTIVRIDPRTNEIIGRIETPYTRRWHFESSGGLPDLVPGRFALFAVGTTVAYRIEVPDLTPPP